MKTEAGPGFAFGEIAGLALVVEVQGNLVLIPVTMFLICQKIVLTVAMSGRMKERIIRHLSMTLHILEKVVEDSLAKLVADILGKVVELGIRLKQVECFVEEAAIFLENEEV